MNNFYVLCPSQVVFPSWPAATTVVVLYCAVGNWTRSPLGNLASGELQGIEDGDDKQEKEEDEDAITATTTAAEVPTVRSIASQSTKGRKKEGRRDVLPAVGFLVLLCRVGGWKCKASSSHISLHNSLGLSTTFSFRVCCRQTQLPESTTVQRETFSGWSGGRAGSAPGG